MRPASTFSFIQLSNTRVKYPDACIAASLIPRMLESGSLIGEFDKSMGKSYTPIFDSCMEKKTL